MDCITLKQRYIDACKRHGIIPNKDICTSLYLGRMKISQHEPCILEFTLDHLMDCDFLPLYELFMDIDESLIHGVHVYNKTLCVMNGGYVLSLVRALNKKLCAVYLNDLSVERGFLRDLSKGGLACKVLNLRSCHLRQLNLTGGFMQLHTLNLDFNTSLSSFQENCFSFMPNLKHLSVCTTRVSNLRTTGAALSKLPSLIELRFQSCLCCNNTGPCPESTAKRTLDSNWSGYCDDLFVRKSSRHNLLPNQSHLAEEMLRDTSVIEDASFTENFYWPRDDISEQYEVDAPNNYQELSFPEFLSNALHNFDWPNSVQAPLDIPLTEDGDLYASGFYSSQAQTFDGSEKRKYLAELAHQPSPVCFEKHYRDYIISSLPQLQVLDNLPVTDTDKESAKFRFLENFEYLPYRRRRKESVVSILNKREINSSQTAFHKRKTSCQFHYRSLGAAKVGASPWPFLHPLSTFGNVFGDENKIFRPRQFEYHPSDSGLMAFGTLDGEVVVVNHENAKIFSYIPSLGALNSVLGLCWLKKYPSKIIAGSDNGSLRLYDVQHWKAAVTGRNFNASGFVFDDFDQLTSVHVNATDDLFIASGYSKNVALYDINTGKRLNMFSDMHQQHINVVKFSNHSPSVFATSSFDQDVKMWDLRQGPSQPCFKASSSRGNVMVCFSPDDLYLLVSAVDNEVKQLSATDGRILLDFEIPSTGSSQNYTRSYYMNGRDYIISGSCDENIVRICCAQTGRRLRDISLEGRASGASMYVQSLRGDPFREGECSPLVLNLGRHNSRIPYVLTLILDFAVVKAQDFNMSILAAYMRLSSKSEIIKVNLLASSDDSADPSDEEAYLPSFGMGG